MLRELGISLAHSNKELSLNKFDVKNIDHTLYLLIKNSKNKSELTSILTNTTNKYIKRLSEDGLIKYYIDIKMQIVDPSVTKKAEQFSTIGGYSNLLPKEKSKLRKFLYDPWTISIGAGLILLFVGILLTSKSESNDIQIGWSIKPIVQISNYRIKASSDKWIEMDTLQVHFRYQGTKAVINSDFKIVKVEFIDERYILKTDGENNFTPELKLIETFNPNPILDSINLTQKVLLQIKRRIIFKGSEVGDFNKEDKRNIGSIDISFSYNLNGTVILDTLKSDIYIEKL